MFKHLSKYNFIIIIIIIILFFSNSQLHNTTTLWYTELKYIYIF